MPQGWYIARMGHHMATLVYGRHMNRRPYHHTVVLGHEQGCCTMVRWFWDISSTQTCMPAPSHPWIAGMSTKMVILPFGDTNMASTGTGLTLLLPACTGT